MISLFLFFAAGEERSTALLSLTAFLALVDCTSSVVYLPYMAYFKDGYLSGFYIGNVFCTSTSQYRKRVLYESIMTLFQGRALVVCFRDFSVLRKASEANQTVKTKHKWLATKRNTSSWLSTLQPDSVSKYSSSACSFSFSCRLPLSRYYILHGLHNGKS